MNHLSLSLATAQVTYDRAPGARNAVTASVHNARTHAERVVVGAYVVSAVPAAPGGPAGTAPAAAGGAAAAAHLATVETPVREVGPGATEQYVISLHGADVAAGTYEIKVIAYPADRAPEEYSDRGQLLRVVVPPRSGPVPAPPAKRRWWLVALVAAILVAVVAVGLFLTRPRTAVVPNVVGMLREAALQELADLDLVADVQEVVSSGETGTVLAQLPGPGAELPTGSRVVVHVAVEDPGGFDPVNPGVLDGLEFERLLPLRPEDLLREVRPDRVDGGP